MNTPMQTRPKKLTQKRLNKAFNALFKEPRDDIVTANGKEYYYLGNPSPSWLWTDKGWVCPEDVYKQTKETFLD